MAGLPLAFVTVPQAPFPSSCAKGTGDASRPSELQKTKLELRDHESCILGNEPANRMISITGITAHRV